LGEDSVTTFGSGFVDLGDFAIQATDSILDRKTHIVHLHPGG
jgi:hypothetical protein